VRWAVCTVSDRSASGVRPDASGITVRGLLEGCLGSGLVSHPVLADEQDVIASELRRLCDEEVCDVVVTTGGTGLSPRDVTPEATLAVVERLIPGMAEAIRAVGREHTPHAMLSRAVCGLRGQTIIVNLSGSPDAAREQLAVILPVLPHAIATASGIPSDCGRPTAGRRMRHAPCGIARGHSREDAPDPPFSPWSRSANKAAPIAPVSCGYCATKTFLRRSPRSS